MEQLIISQIQILQELKSKCLEVTGFYGDIGTAIAALQICSTFGMDNTARILGTLNSNGIKSFDELAKVIEDSKLNNALLVLPNSKLECLCPKCNAVLYGKSKHCPDCGQKLKYDNEGGL